MATPDKPWTSLGRTRDDLLGVITGPFAEEQIDDSVYVTIGESALQYLIVKDRVTTVFMHSRAYGGELPGGITFSLGRSAVRRLLGRPLQQGSQQKLRVFGQMPAWDLFDHDGMRLHIEYELDEASIRMITAVSSRD